ncbi:RES domain-containing protein [Brevundimonas aurantiaca]|uniref:RES domain-containing protein n=1 Tax=Brevundimonas aurantiaca TaxID=74316 RepID=UPI0015FEE0B0|nr:RES domain-containing protein [Pseudomonas sp. FW305-3-2-15-E-TSA4]
MILDAETIKAFSVERTLVDFIRVTPLAHKATPLGLGYGKTRFASPDDAFKVLYLGKTLATGVAETVIRDRFVNRRKRRLTRDEIGTWGVTVVGAATPLTLLDLTEDGLLALGAPTDAARGKNHRAGRALSADIYTQAPAIDGVLYLSRLTGAPCVAVYDRGVGKLRATSVRPLVRQPELIPALARLKIELL